MKNHYVEKCLARKSRDIRFRVFLEKLRNKIGVVNEHEFHAIFRLLTRITLAHNELTIGMQQAKASTVITKHNSNFVILDNAIMAVFVWFVVNWVKVCVTFLV